MFFLLGYLFSERNIDCRFFSLASFRQTLFLLDQMLAGLNLNVGVNGATGTGAFGNVGTNNAAGVYQSGAAQLRRSATFQASLANGDLNAAANSLLGLIPTGLQTLPTDPSTNAGYFGTTNHPTPALRTLPRM